MFLRRKTKSARGVGYSYGHFAGLVAPGAAAPAQWEQADVRQQRLERSCDFGECYLGLALWHRLRRDALLAELLPAGREAVA